MDYEVRVIYPPECQHNPATFVLSPFTIGDMLAANGRGQLDGYLLERVKSVESAGSEYASVTDMPAHLYGWTVKGLRDFFVSTAKRPSSGDTPPPPDTPTGS